MVRTRTKQMGADLHARLLEVADVLGAFSGCGKELVDEIDVGRLHEHLDVVRRFDRRRCVHAERLDEAPMLFRAVENDGAKGERQSPGTEERGAQDRRGRATPDPHADAQHRGNQTPGT